MVESAFKGGSTRVETHVDPDDETAQRVATFAGLMREGVARGVAAEDEQQSDRIVYARLVDDTPVEDPRGFRSLLNSFLPRKRAISQLLVRSTDGRVLLCQLTYKRDYDLPGGVVEVSESPQLAVAREVEEELGLTVEPGRLLLTDWLPPVGWLGRRPVPGLRRRRDRPVGRRHDRAPGARDPLRRLLHDRRGAREVRRLHRPADRGRPAQPDRRARPGVHRERAWPAGRRVAGWVLGSGQARSSSGSSTRGRGAMVAHPRRSDLLAELGVDPRRRRPDRDPHHRHRPGDVREVGADREPDRQPGVEADPQRQQAQRQGEHDQRDVPRVRPLEHGQHGHRPDRGDVELAHPGQPHPRQRGGRPVVHDAMVAGRRWLGLRCVDKPVQIRPALTRWVDTQTRGAPHAPPPDRRTEATARAEWCARRSRDRSLALAATLGALPGGATATGAPTGTTADLAPTASATTSPNPTNPLRGRRWGVYKGRADMSWAPYAASTGTERDLLAKISLRPKAQWFGAWISNATIATQDRPVHRERDRRRPGGARADDDVPGEAVGARHLQAAADGGRGQQLQAVDQPARRPPSAARTSRSSCSPTAPSPSARPAGRKVYSRLIAYAAQEVLAHCRTRASTSTPAPPTGPPRTRRRPRTSWWQPASSTPAASRPTRPTTRPPRTRSLPGPRSSPS